MWVDWSLENIRCYITDSENEALSSPRIGTELQVKGIFEFDGPFPKSDHCFVITENDILGEYVGDDGAIYRQDIFDEFNKSEESAADKYVGQELTVVGEVIVTGPTEAQPRSDESGWVILSPSNTLRRGDAIKVSNVVTRFWSGDVQLQPCKILTRGDYQPPEVDLSQVLLSTDVYQHFLANRFAAESIYGGHELSVRGVVTYNDLGWIGLDGGQSISVGVACDLSHKDIADSAQIERGDEIEIRGMLLWFSINVGLNPCEVSALPQ